MKQSWQHYHRPASVEEALQILHRYDGRARVVGGGSDLFVEMRRGLRRAVEAIVDVTGIVGLDRISKDEQHIVIGCAVTHSQIAANARIRATGSCLAESCAIIGGPQVRNVGTLAGNVAQALPAGDGSIGLLALGGEIEVAGSGGVRRWMPLEASFRGPGKSSIDRHREVLTRLRFRPTGAGEGSAHWRVMRPQGLCLPIVSMAVRLRLDADGTIREARLSIGPAGPVPQLAAAATQALLGGPACQARFDAASEAVLQSITLRDSRYRASQAYRAEMIRRYLPLILARAAERAGGAP